MRATEFITEDDVTASGDVAPAVMPMGTIQRRIFQSTQKNKKKNKNKK